MLLKIEWTEQPRATKDFSSPNVNGAKAEKPCLTCRRFYSETWGDPA